MPVINSDSLSTIFASPVTGKDLYYEEQSQRLFNDEESFGSESGVLVFLEKQNENYEGAYFGNVKYIPKKESFPYILPLWLMVNGYVWEVRKHFPKGSVLCELGCASGVDYFGERYSMIGLDFSLQSLQRIKNYKYRIQANALFLPFKDNSLDGIISAYFWEHIDPADKEQMLKEFRRVLRPDGKVIMVYDVETNNSLLKLLKDDDIRLYEELFLEGDFHIGYETLEANREKFERNSFRVLKHLGMERTFFQSTSVYYKLSQLNTWYGKFSKMMTKLNSTRITEYINILAMRLTDITLGRLVKPDKSRIAISVLQKIN